MDQMACLRILKTVVEAGSFVAAAERLNLSTAAVTRHVAALERHLETRLLHRTTRSLSLSDAGALYLERTLPLLEELHAADQALRDSALSPQGTLRLNAPVSFGLRHLGPALAEFRRRAPELNLDVALSDRFVDLAEEGYDLALRIGRLKPSALIARPITRIATVLCAAPAYLAEHGEPRHPRDLREHDCLLYSYLDSRFEWHFTRDGATGVESESVRVRGDIMGNNGDLLAAMAENGAGIVLQPSFIVHDALRAGRLVPILQDWRTPRLDLHAVYLHRRHLSAKVRAFIDFLAQYWPENWPEN